MKTVIIPLFAGLVLSCAQSPANAQQYTEHISKEFSLPKAASANVLSVYNITGPISVQGYAGDKVIIEVEETISAKSNEILEQGKKEVKLRFEQVGDTLWAYIASPYDSRPHRYNDPWDERERIEYRYAFAYTIKVPFGMNMNVSTVNNGDVLVKDVAGSLRVRNVNGAINIVNAKGATDARTINGALTVSYLSNPPDASSYYTLNGKLTVIYQPGLSADLEFKSMNGGFYTDFPDAEVLPAKVTLSQEKKSDGTIYKINKNTAVRIGAGGKLLKFETLNGNIYIQKQS